MRLPPNGSKFYSALNVECDHGYVSISGLWLMGADIAVLFLLLSFRIKSDQKLNEEWNQDKRMRIVKEHPGFCVGLPYYVCRHKRYLSNPIAKWE